jgi:hypothetical protein
MYKKIDEVRATSTNPCRVPHDHVPVALAEERLSDVSLEELPLCLARLGNVCWQRPPLAAFLKQLKVNLHWNQMSASRRYHIQKTNMTNTSARFRFLIIRV